MAHCYFRVCFHHNKQYKKANIVNNIAVISSDSYQTKLSVESRDSRTVILSDRSFISHQTTIVDSFYCTVYIILFKIMHALLNQYYTENRSILVHWLCRSYPSFDVETFLRNGRRKLLTWRQEETITSRTRIV